MRKFIILITLFAMCSISSNAQRKIKARATILQRHSIVNDPTQNNNKSSLHASQSQIKNEKAIGGSGDDFCFGDNIVRMPDGSIIAMGETASGDGDFTLNKGGYDAFIMKLDE